MPSSTANVSTRSGALSLSRPSTLKRSRVSYTENTFYDTTNINSTDGDFDPHAAKKAKKAAKAAAAAAANSDDDEPKKGGKGGFVDKYVPPPPPKAFPVYRPKPFQATVGKSFVFPGIKRKGVLVETKLTHHALGTRKPVELIPRPLFDPLEDHAIVLWDPTIDDREAEREAERERLKREAEDKDDGDEKKLLDAEEKERRKVHRSLADILGLSSDADKKKRWVKVPVVIDPRVGKVLRPHQVEGVKFLYKCVTGMTDENAYGCVPSLAFAACLPCEGPR